MTLLTVGVNYRTASLDLRERVAIPSRDIPDTLHAIRTHASIQEAVILSTCNRVECYVATTDRPAAQDHLLEIFAARARLSPVTLASHSYQRTDTEAAAHLFRVAVGLESMILGESEITAQVKHAYVSAQAAGTTGPTLHRLFQKALHSAKLIRSRTRLAEGQASIGSVVVALAKRRFGDRLDSREVLLWGAGKAAETTARHLTKAGIGGLWIVNRTETKAQDLASVCRGGWVSWEQARAHVAHVDLAIVCTQAPHYVLDASDVEAVRASRGSRPLVLIDLAVPRNIDPRVAQEPGVELYNIDELQMLTQRTLATRQEEQAQCEALIQDQVDYVWRWWQSRNDTEVRSCRFVEACSSVLA